MAREMVKLLKITGVTLALALLVWIIKVWSFASDYRDRISQITPIEVKLGEELPELKSVDLVICESVNHYSLASLKRGFPENVGVPANKMPCPTKVIYHFRDGRLRTFEADSLLQTNPSGERTIILYRDRVRTRDSY